MINETPTGETFWSKFIKTLDHSKILTAKGLVKILQKIIKPAGETSYGMVNYQTIRTISPKPDLSPYMRWDRGYRNSNNSDYVLRANLIDAWAPRHLHMYLENGDYMGAFHLNGGRAYYKVPSRAGGGWCEIMDNHDMASRDNRMNNMDADRNNVRNLAQDARNVAGDAWNKANDAQLNRVANMRLTSLISIPVWYGQTYERVGYVVTGFNNADGDIGGGDHMYMRCLQLQFGHGGWVTVWE